jgi:hypothetical protein
MTPRPLDVSSVGRNAGAGGRDRHSGGEAQMDFLSHFEADECGSLNDGVIAKRDQVDRRPPQRE